MKRFLFGVLASLFFAAGFARAANHLDPLSLSSRGGILQSEEPYPPSDDSSNDGER